MSLTLSALDRHKTLNAMTRSVAIAHWGDWKAHSSLIRFENITANSLLNDYPADVIFPTSAIFSYSSTSLTGGLAESSLVGNEGCIGLWMLTTNPHSAVHFSLQTAGFGIVVSADFLKREVAVSSDFRLALLNQASATVRYATQTCFCYRHHSIKQQVTKMVLLTVKRTGRLEIDLTHQMIGAILGIRRESVSAALRHLQDSNLVTQKRGRILVSRVEELEAEACECYPLLCRDLGYTQIVAARSQDDSHDF